MKPFARINLSSVLSFVALAKEEALAKGDALRRWILVSSLALMAVIGADVRADVEKPADITWYSPVGVSFMDNAYPWVGRYRGHGDKPDNPGVIGLGVNFLLGECGEVNGLLLNIGILGFCGHLGKG